MKPPDDKSLPPDTNYVFATEAGEQFTTYVNALKQAQESLTQEVSTYVLSVKDHTIDLSQKVSDYIDALRKEELSWKSAVADQLEEARESARALREAGSSLTVQIAQELQKQQRVLIELNIYKWGLRIFFAIVLGGTVFGLLRFETHLKRLISHQMGPDIKDFKSKLDTFEQRLLSDRSAFEQRLLSDEKKHEDKVYQFQVDNYKFQKALAFANVQNYDDALPLMFACYEDMRAGKWVVTDENEKVDVYAYMCRIIAGLDRSVGAWKGKAEWDALSNEKDFQKEVLEANWLRTDAATNIWIAQCYLKFAPREDAVTKAARHYLTAENAETVDAEKADELFELAMIDVFNNDLAAARLKLHQVYEDNPYHSPPFDAPADIDVAIKAYKKGSDYLLFRFQGGRDNPGFDDALERLKAQIEQSSTAR